MRDLEINLFMFLLHLIEEKNKEYSTSLCEKNKLYIFENYDDYCSYFVDNGIDNINDELLETCKLKTTKKGKVLALKALCDYTITRLIKPNEHVSLSEGFTKESHHMVEKKKELVLTNKK